MAITHEQFIQLLAEKLGLNTEEVSDELNQLIDQIQQETAKGDEFTIDKFGIFKVKNGRLSFEVDPTFALEINFKYAGMTPVELKGGKTATVTDEEMGPLEKPEPEEEISARESYEKEEIPKDESVEPESEEGAEEPEEEAQPEQESDWVPGEVAAEAGSSDTQQEEKKNDRKSDQERAHIYRSPNRLLNDDELPKRRTGLFVVIVLVLAVLFAGYYLIVQRGGAPVVENTVGESQGDSVYIRDDNVKPEVRNRQRANEEDTTAGTAGITATAPDSTEMASDMTNSSGDQSASMPKAKKAAASNTADVSASVAAKDSVAAKNIMNDLTATSLYGLHGKTSNDIGDYYTIVIASLRDQSKAQSVGKRWGTRNYRVVVAPGQVHGQTWYRVGLGQFSSISDAENAVKGLPNRLQDNKHHFIRRIHQ
ncbi:MAG TPA: SPOR domain-containing protein [Balneolales bacterium]|nr:SPOR domain-containing protein [Balneolales bacterium]